MNNKQSYIRFAIMVVISFIAMYAFMYSMVDVFANIIPNLNQFYMAGLMTAPMIILEMIIMGSMYMNKKLNISITLLGIIMLIFCWFGIRQQFAIGDREFLKSMIPHHAGAILMCQEAKITDPEIRQLCDKIVAGQNQEIEQMKNILARENDSK